MLSKIVGGFQVNSFLSWQSGTLVNVTSNANVLNAPGVPTTQQRADKVKDGPGSITDTVRIGRQYDERELRLGLRFGF